MHQNDLKILKTNSNNFKNSLKKQKQTGYSKREKKIEMVVRGFFLI
jgi:hypothetical protein